MKAANFEYFAPKTTAEACDLLTRSPSGHAITKVLAGGQSLVPLMNFRLAQPSRLVDINGIVDLQFGNVDGRSIEIGALYRQRQVERNIDIMNLCGAIRDAVPLVGHVAIRNRGTVAGSLAHGDPLAEWCSLILLFDCKIMANSSRGSRSIQGENWLKGFLQTDLAYDEFVTSVSFDLGTEGSGSAFVELSRRHGDFAIVSAGTRIELDAAGGISDARVVVAGLQSIPRRMAHVEEFLLNKPPRDEVFAEAANLARDVDSAADDLHASAAYRREVVGPITKRALMRAAGRVGKGGMQ